MSGYYPPPGFHPPGYSAPMWPTPVVRPGVIPLRPLTLSDVFNGAVAYVRANPRATLGLTAIVVVTSQVVALLFQIGPLTSADVLAQGRDGQSGFSDSALVGLLASEAASVVTSVLAAIVLSGLLTVVVGRAVFGATIGMGEAWRRARGRLLPLLGVTVLEAAGAALLIAVAVGLVAAVDRIVGDAAAFAVGAVLALALVALLVYLYTVLSFAPALVVLERIGVLPALARSIALVRHDFWRVFGIRLLAAVAAGIVSFAVTMPFAVVGSVLQLVDESTGAAVAAVVLAGVGSAVGQIVTAPFTAGVVVLLYTDRRIRAEAFDLVLQTGASPMVHSTDDLWLTPRR
ncbi:DUF7847 domain-containing protein [Mycolicibacterium madagascariense]|nr:hypothetical protein [Mycolicibacterium madagascariense]MCV7015094.1 hypothetical protein [Mycolicibacterium madagascariense]